jgi:predicted ATPase
MRVNSFAVEGYKNLTAEVSFGPLDQISVLHGPNNAGKSNLLAALDLFFGLLATGNQVSKDQSVSMDPSEQIKGYPFAEIFNVVEPVPIRLRAELSLPGEELRQLGVEPECETDPTTIALELTPVASGAQLRVTQFQMGVIDVARDGSGPVGFAESLRAFIAGTFFMQTEETVRPYALIEPYRCTPEDGMVGLVPQRLVDALFDARQSIERDLRTRWGLFQQGMRVLENELGPGEFDTAFDRSTGRANLVYSSREKTLPLDRLGAGVQRLVALLGSLALARANVVGVGEPELGLTFAAQQRFLRAVVGILSAPTGPGQLLFTTHSPVLGGLEAAFALELQDGAPAVVQRPLEGAIALPPLERLSVGGSTDRPAAGDLDQLIGLVDQLAEMEPEQLVAAAPAPKATQTKAAAARTPEAEQPAAAANGAPPWKWQEKK